MGIRLDISVETPLSADDGDIRAGIRLMMPAIDNRQNLADQAEQLVQAEEEGEPLPCSEAPPLQVAPDGSIWVVTWDGEMLIATPEALATAELPAG